MKRIKALVCALLTISIVFLCSCKKSEQYPLTVNNTPLDREIFCYYLDEAFSSAEATDKESRITYATNMCIRYVAVNSTFAEKGLTLTAAENAEVTETSNVLWNMFDAHYSAVGVSKETFMKIRMSLAYTEKLRFSLFDKGGQYEIADSELKNYFSENYVSFKLIRGYLFTTDVYGNTVEYTDDELTDILDRYNTACDEINRGIAIETMYASLAGSDQQIQQNLSTEVIDDGDPYYPAGFYERVKNISEGKASVCVFGDYLYLVYRVGILSDPQIFEKYRTKCLTAVSETPLQSEVNRMCNAFKSVRRPELVEEYYDDIVKIKTQS